MPAKTPAQQKLFGMVHAYKNDELKNASPEVKKISRGISDKDATDFASTKHSEMHETPDEMDSSYKVLEAIARYNEYRGLLQRETSLSQIAEDLSELAEQAESAIMEEGEGKYDSYDNYTIKRNLQEFSKYVSEFSKFAKEADTLEQRISALHSDMGRILERYFDPEAVSEIANGLPTTSADTSSGSPDDSAEASVRGSDVKGSLGIESVHEDKIQEWGMHTATHPANHTVPPVKKNLIPAQKTHMNRIDELTVRACRAVYENLRKNNPDAAKKFRRLGAKKQLSLVWKLVR